MHRRTLDELQGYEILAKPVMAEDFCIILPEGAVLKPSYIKKLRELEIQKVYIKDDAEEESILILKSEMEQEARKKIKEVLEHHTYHHNEELMQLCETADNIIVSIVQEDEVAEQVFDVKERSADIYEHSLSICTLAVLTALKMNMPQDMVHEIGVGCLLHDIGLRYLAIDYSGENLSSLSEADMAEFKKHPVYGYSALKDENWISDTGKSIILYHHERLDGTGYPLRAASLTEAIQIVNVCDTFDEMICGIGCRKCKVYEAVEYLKTFKNIKFGATIVDTFLKFVAVYPTGSRVRTNEGEIGIVVRQNKEFPERPVLRILEDKSGMQPQKEILKDLVKIHHVFIEETLDD